MQSVLLAGRPTTSIGFGGSSLGSNSPAASRRLLAAAFDHGIRHFDVAPMYGFGQSESILREALGPRMQDVTVTTKYGLAPPKHAEWIGPVHRLARKVLGPLPTIRQRLRPAPVVAEAVSGPPLTASAAQASLEASLRALGRESVDLFLLHEAVPERLHDPGLLAFLERMVESGRIRAFGIGSRSDRALACLHEATAFCPVIQTEWSVFSPVRPALTPLPCILHGSLGGQRETFLEWLLNDAARAKRWCAAASVDLLEPGMLNRLLFKASLERNAGHIVLFSTRSERNLVANVATDADPRLAAPAGALHRLIQAEYSQ